VVTFIISTFGGFFYYFKKNYATRSKSYVFGSGTTLACNFVRRFLFKVYSIDIMEDE
jgi:hypothetical protein